MRSFPNIMLYLLIALIQGFVVYVFVIQRLFRQFLFLNLYLLLSAAATVSRYAILHRFGLASAGYFSFYSVSHALLGICLFFSICQLSARLVGDIIPRRKIALFSLAGFAATACASLPASGLPNATAIFAINLSQNFSLVCGLVIVALWAWKLQNHPTDWISNRLVNALTVYLLLFALAYVSFQIAPRSSGGINLVPIREAWLPLGSGFALMSPEPRQTE
ncbi:MAG: hypothetical protein WAK48_03985 [Candidatus Acidiferrum sp.]|jgi:hypothetical protein